LINFVSGLSLRYFPHWFDQNTSAGSRSS